MMRTFAVAFQVTVEGNEFTDGQIAEWIRFRLMETAECLSIIDDTLGDLEARGVTIRKIAEGTT